MVTKVGSLVGKLETRRGGLNIQVVPLGAQSIVLRTGSIGMTMKSDGTMIPQFIYPLVMRRKNATVHGPTLNYGWKIINGFTVLWYCSLVSYVTYVIALKLADVRY